LNLEEEFHHIASKLCILGFEPRKESPLIHPRDFRIPQWQSRSFEGMSLRTASPSPSTFTCKLQAQYMTHEPSPDPQWFDGTYVFRNAPDHRPKNAKKPRVGGAEFGRKPSKVSTAHAVPDENEASADGAPAM
jgi:hypothetical protein